MIADLRKNKLPRAFFARDARVVARALVGTTIVHVVGGRARVARIVETEAYRGPRDAACHARFGETARTRPIFGPPGMTYCFLVYGMHDCFNVVTREKGSGHAVLVRAAEAVHGVELRADGPGRFARALGFTRKDSSRSCVAEDLFFAPRDRKTKIAITPRVGVAYAGDDADLLLRFFDAESKHVSRPPRVQIGRGASRGAVAGAKSKS